MKSRLQIARSDSGKAQIEVLPVHSRDLNDQFVCEFAEAFINGEGNFICTVKVERRVDMDDPAKPTLPVVVIRPLDKAYFDKFGLQVDIAEAEAERLKDLGCKKIPVINTKATIMAYGINDHMH